VVSTNNRLSYWGAIEGSVSLLVASLPVIGGRMISHWRHILTRHTTRQSGNINKSFRQKQSNHTLQSAHSVHEMSPGKFDGRPFTGSEKTVETVISAGSTLRDSPGGEHEEPASLMQHMARMGRRGSNHFDPNDRNSNVVTVKKEVYIREEHTEPV
jgi:hypothetical protein